MFRFSRSKPLILMLSSRLKVQTERVRYWKLKTMEIPGNSMCTLMDQISVIQQQVLLQVIWQLIWCHIINSYTYTYTVSNGSEFDFLKAEDDENPRRLNVKLEKSDCNDPETGIPSQAILWLTSNHDLTAQLYTNWGLAGKADHDPTLPLLFNDNPASRTSVISIPNTVFFPKECILCQDLGESRFQRWAFKSSISSRNFSCSLYFGQWNPARSRQYPSRPW